MELREYIISIYPSLTNQDFLPKLGTIILQNDSDGKGTYIIAWNCTDFPRPTKEQLAGAGYVV